MKVVKLDCKFLLIEEDKILAGTLRTGTFTQKPIVETNFIYGGFYLLLY